MSAPEDIPIVRFYISGIVLLAIPVMAFLMLNASLLTRIPFPQERIAWILFLLAYLFAIDLLWNQKLYGKEYNYPFPKGWLGALSFICYFEVFWLTPATYFSQGLSYMLFTPLAAGVIGLSLSLSSAQTFYYKSRDKGPPAYYNVVLAASLVTLLALLALGVKLNIQDFHIWTEETDFLSKYVPNPLIVLPFLVISLFSINKAITGNKYVDVLLLTIPPLIICWFLYSGVISLYYYDWNPIDHLYPFKILFPSIAGLGLLIKIFKSQWR